MNDDGIQALVDAAKRVASGEQLSTELMGSAGVPVALRLVLAAAVLTAADLPVNKKTITAIAPAARSATYRDHARLLEDAKNLIPALVQAQLAVAGAKVSAADLARQLDHANTIIAEERARRKDVEEQLAHVASYARELHWQLKPERDALLRERAEKVRTLRPIDGTRERQ